MGTLTMRPAATFGSENGWTTVGGAGGAAVLADDSDASYYAIDEANASTRWFTTTKVELPPRARVRTMTPEVRLAKTVGSTRWLNFNLGQPKSTGGVDTGRSPSSVSASSTITTKSGNHYGAWLNSVNQVITQERLDKLLIGIAPANRAYTTGLRVYETYVQVEYDEAPVVTYEGPTGTIVDTANPTIFWHYVDDYEPQIGYRVQVRDATTEEVVYDSADPDLGGSATQEVTADNFHKLNQPLAVGDYEARVQVRQRWESIGAGRPGGEFWSTWTAWADGALAIASIEMAAPYIDAVVDGEHVELSLDHQLNLLPVDLAHAETGVPTWDEALGVTIDPLVAGDEFFDGAFSVYISVTNGTNGGSIGHHLYRVPARPNTPYYGRAMIHPDTGATASGAVIRLNFYDSTGAFLSQSDGTSVSHPVGAWTKIEHSAVAPESAAYVQMVVVFPPGAVATGSDYWLDGFHIGYYSPQSGAIGVSAGGIAQVTLNVLAAEDADLRLGANWVGGSGTTVSYIPDAAGLYAMSLHRTTAGTHSATLEGDRQYTPASPGERWFIHAIGSRANEPGVDTAHVTLHFLDETLTPLVSQQTAVTLVAINQWYRMFDPAGFTAPDGTAFVRITMGGTWDGAGSGTVYFSKIALYKNDIPLGWQPGSYISENPATVVEYSEDEGATWRELDSLSIVDSFPQEQETEQTFLSTFDTTQATSWGPEWLHVDASPSESGELDVFVSGGQAQWVQDGTFVSWLQSFEVVDSLPDSRDATIEIEVQHPDLSQFEIMVIGRFSDETNFYALWATVSSTAADLRIRRPTATWGTSNSNLAGPTATVNTALGVAVRIKFQLEGSSLRGKMWEAGTSEPDWQVTATDSVVVTPGKHGIGYRHTSGSVDPPRINEIEMDGPAIAVAGTVFLVDDYEPRHGIERIYRARNVREVDTSLEVSPWSASTDPSVVSTPNVWLHKLADPAGTSHNFVYDGAGRDDALSAAPEKMAFAGRPYAVAEWGEVGSRSISAVLQLSSAEDQAALLDFAEHRGLVVWRDQRGRRLRGFLTVSFADQRWGQEARVTFEAAGEQPWTEGQG